MLLKIIINYNDHDAYDNSTADDAKDDSNDNVNQDENENY